MRVCFLLLSELSCPVNLNLASRVRAGNVLGRGHAALGEHRLSAAAFDDGLALAKAGEHLLSECMCVSGRVLAGRAAGGSGAGEHWWSEEAGHERLAEVLGRMQVNSDLAARLSTGVAAA